jgi:GntR family transcriptional regulator / MocR family aminotransferase
VRRWIHRQLRGSKNDYDAEFRYDQRPIGAVQGLDPEHVVHAGSASKTLAPGVRLGWLTLPDRMVKPVVRAKVMADRGSSVLDQMALAGLIESGDYDRQVRRMRRSYRRRRDLLLATLADRVPSARVLGVAAGVNVVIELPTPGPTEQEVVALGRRRSVLVSGLGSFRQRVAADDRQAIVIGYAQPPWHRYRESVERLADLLHDACAG